MAAPQIESRSAVTSPELHRRQLTARRQPPSDFGRRTSTDPAPAKQPETTERPANCSPQRPQIAPTGHIPGRKSGTERALQTQCPPRLLCLREPPSPAQLSRASSTPVACSGCSIKQPEHRNPGPWRASQLPTSGDRRAPDWAPEHQTSPQFHCRRLSPNRQGLREVVRLWKRANPRTPARLCCRLTIPAPADHAPCTRPRTMGERQVLFQLRHALTTPGHQTPHLRAQLWATIRQLGRRDFIQLHRRWGSPRSPEDRVR